MGLFFYVDFVRAERARIFADGDFGFELIGNEDEFSYFVNALASHAVSKPGVSGPIYEVPDLGDFWQKNKDGMLGECYFYHRVIGDDYLIEIPFGRHGVWLISNIELEKLETPVAEYSQLVPSRRFGKVYCAKAR
ncbi:hypothetical protein JIN82_00705 [Persicirhabdus sediminis]|uniref:Uncharacterized protein n=1 Tax=Persicirhabdus sediminis TaxID=454144 RepID=A0A8J7MC02_9BACT|nr:hypothetical protein [Persicirhabdus sediminis]